jgi:hypothetical protein
MWSIIWIALLAVIASYLIFYERRAITKRLGESVTTVFRALWIICFAGVILGCVWGVVALIHFFWRHS